MFVGPMGAVVFIFMLFSLLFLIPITSFADRGIHLRCPARGEVTISFFGYGLSTMQWGNKFQVATGGISSITIHGKKYKFVGFRNGDDLVFSPGKGVYLLSRLEGARFDTCSLDNRFIYPVINPPRVPSGKVEQNTLKQDKRKVIVLGVGG